MNQEDKDKQRIASMKFDVSDHVERIIDALRNRHSMTPNELGQYAVEIAQEWCKLDIPHDWTVYEATPEEKPIEDKYNDAEALVHIITRVCYEVSHFMKDELGQSLKRIGVKPSKYGEAQDLKFIFDESSFCYLHAYLNKIIWEKNKQAGISSLEGDEMPVDSFNFTELADRILDDLLLAPGKDADEQLNTVANIMTDEMDKADPDLKFMLAANHPNILTNMQFAFRTNTLFEMLEAELCLEFAKNRLARAMSLTPSELCDTLKSLTQKKIKELAE